MNGRPTRTASPTPPTGEFPAGWTGLVAEIEACRRCALGFRRSHVVVYRGAPRPWVLFVGEAPGASEDREGVPFVGRSGKRLDAAIRTVGLAAEQFGILNLIKCRPHQNRFDRGAAAACRPFLDRQLSLLRPRLVVSLGAYALRALDPESQRIGIASGRLVARRAPPLFPLLHPAAPMHNPTLRDRWADDVERLRVYLDLAH